MNTHVSFIGHLFIFFCKGYAFSGHTWSQGCGLRLVYLSDFLVKGYLPRVLRLLANGKGDNEMIPGILYRFPGICLTAEENSGKPQPGDRPMKYVRSVIASNEIGRIAQHVRKGEEGKTRVAMSKTRLIFIPNFVLIIEFLVILII